MSLISDLKRSTIATPSSYFCDKDRYVVMTNQREIIVPWSGRGSVYTEDEIAAVVAAMRDADPQTQGHYQAEFELQFAAYIGTPHAYAVSSCTAALELAA